MAEPINTDIVKHIKTLSNGEIIKQLAEGRQGFREGVYDAFISEAEQRGLNYTIIEEEVLKYKQEDKQKRINRLILWGYMFMIAGGGLGGLIIGWKLYKLAQGSELKANTSAKTNGTIQMIFGGMIFLLVIMGIIVGITRML